MPDSVEATIERLGHEGDGVALIDGARVFVPFTTPGDRVRLVRETGRVRVLARLADGPERVAPRCRHFSVCGGCKLQHLSHAAYAGFKRAQVEAALAQRGLASAPVRDLLALAPGTRRRAALSFLRTEDGAVLGFHAYRSHARVDVEECPVLVPALVEALPGLRQLIRSLFAPGAQGMMSLLQTEAGLDVALTLARPGANGMRLRLGLAEAARRLDLARMALDGEVIVERRAPVVRLSGIPVVPPPGAFLQASAEAERALTALVREAVGPARRVADLFAGLGTFTFALAREALVHAVDSSADSLAALDRAARHAEGLKPVTTEARDLFRAPLEPEALARFDAVVIDPPRAGARAQAERLAASGVPRIAAVSCAPASFARDARILADGGFRLDWVKPVDQFLWSAGIELVAQLSRERRRQWQRRSSG